MPTGQRHDKTNKTTPFVSDEVALVIYAALLAAWMGCLMWLSLASRLPSVPRLFAWDKLQHFSAYAVLMFFSGNFFRLLFKKRLKGWIIGFIFSVGFGLMMEIGQMSLSASRHADWKDLIANSLGAGLILAVALLSHKNRS
jgi:glycopeptide antibiotics resistance protein